MTLITDLTAYQTANRMGVDLLASVLNTDKITLSRFLNASAPETDNQARAQAALEVSIRRYLKANKHARPDGKVRTHVRTKNLGPTNARRPTLDVHQEARRQAALALCDIMRRRGLRDTETATISGLHKSTICSWRQAERVPTHESIDQLQRLVRVTADLTGTERGSISKKTHHPMIDDLLGRMGMSISSDKHAILAKGKEPENLRFSSPSKPPIRSSGRNDLVVSLPEPPLQTTFSTDDDLVIIRRVYDSIERIEVAS